MNATCLHCGDAHAHLSEHVAACAHCVGSCRQSRIRFPDNVNRLCTCMCPDCRKGQHHRCENKFHAHVYQEMIVRSQGREAYIREHS